MKMKKERIFDYAGIRISIVEEIKRMMTETKEQDSEITFTRACEVLLTIFCC